MAFPQTYCVEWLKGHEVTKRRGLAWLIARPTVDAIDGKSQFEAFESGVRDNLRNRFDWWLRTFGVTKKEYCHGWTEEGYENVWVFKYREHRIFGFLCHPDEGDGAFQMCVLCSYTIKEGYDADVFLKKLMAKFAEDPVKLEASRNVHISDDCPHEERNSTK